MATVDAWIISEGNWLPLEIKNVTFQAQRWDHGPPESVWIQVQHQLAVCGAQRAYVAAYFGGRAKGEVFEIERDNGFIKRHLVPVERAFWQKVEQGEPPDPTANASSKRVLNRLYPPKEEREVADLTHLAQLDAEIQEKVAEGKALEATITERKNTIIQALAGAQEGRVPGALWTYYPNKNGVRSLKRKEDRSDD
jgi:predicted phage-related endonuclease